MPLKLKLKLKAQSRPSSAAPQPAPPTDPWAPGSALLAPPLGEADVRRVYAVVCGSAGGGKKGRGADTKTHPPSLSRPAPARPPLTSPPWPPPPTPSPLA